MTNNDLEISFPMDESIKLSGDAKKQAFDRVDELMEKTIEAKDPVIATNGLSQLAGLERIAGLCKAKLLYRLKESWVCFETEENFKDFIMEHTSLSGETVDRYVLVWEMYEMLPVPEALVPELMARTMRDQVEIAKIADRVQLTEKDWKAIASTANGYELATLKREMTKQEPRKSGITIRLRRNGDLEAIDSKRSVYMVGYLNVKEAETSPMIAKAIERLTRTAGVLVE
jgi:hypothetical protein